MENISKFINNIELKNRSKVIAILKDVINNGVKINKLMLAYDLNIKNVLSDNQFIETKRNAFCEQFSKTYGMSIDVCEQIFDDWCDLLGIVNPYNNYYNEKTCKDIVNNKLCYLTHFYNCYCDTEIQGDIIDDLCPWFYALCNNHIELIDLNKDYSSMSDSIPCEILANIKKIVFESNCDIDKKQGKIVINDKNNNCKLKILYSNNELRFYTDAYKFVIPDSVIIRRNERSITYKAFFSCLVELKEIIGLHNICTASNKNLFWLFSNCHNLKTVDVSKWDTSNVIDMCGMFDGCNSLKTIDVSKWDTSNVTDMSSMFSKCHNLKTIDVSKWDTSNVTDMSSMFDECNSLETIDVSKWDTSNVIDMWGMFDACNSLKTIDVSKWDTSKVMDKDGIFY